MARRSWPGVALAVAVLVSVACGSSSSDTSDAGGSSCVSAPSCPTTNVPSYQNEIAPIIQVACAQCHGPDGSAGFDESTYADVHGQFGSMLSQVALCQMPPVNGPQLTDAQRVALTAWLKCGAPDN